MKAPKVLIVAENASASFGGEALIPLQYFMFLRKIGVDVHLLVHERTQKELLKLLPDEAGRLHFVYDSLVNIWVNKAGQLMPYFLATYTVAQISHFDTQIRQRRLARSLIRTHCFDIVHEPIPVSPKLPSIMFGLSVPVIIGPMNGGMDYPPNYNSSGIFERLMIFILRCTSPYWNIVLPGKLQAAVLLVANKRTYNALPFNLKKKQIIELVENGVDAELFRPAARSENLTKINVIYVGALIFWKRVDLLISACARLVGQVNFQLHVVGDGPERIGLENQVQQLRLTEQVRFHGVLSHSAAADLLRDSDIMAHPAMRECGGAVVLEAMASGIPVIAADWGGPADYIDANTGILIAPATPNIFVSRLADAILLLAKNQQLRREMGKAARLRVHELYDWRVKAKALVQIYKDVLTRNSGGIAGRAENERAS
jgi:glycosyltransferase involved in cell wall biosynthesis